MKNYTPRLFDIYKKDIQPSLMKKLNIKNVMQLPKIEKIILNIGMGEAKDNKNNLSQAVDEMMIITGQKPIITKAKHAISNFKIRAGDPVGVMATLRGVKMYEFLDRFISISSPRIRDFRGFSSKGFDGRGNYNFGVSEQIIFPEIDYDKVSSIRGMNITIVTSSSVDEFAYELLVGFGFPIKELNNNNKSPHSSKKEVNEHPIQEEVKNDSDIDLVSTASKELETSLKEEGSTLNEEKSNDKKD